MVSIIIPVYNIENYMHRAVESAINQTYKDIEIIIVDDGSTDSSPAKSDEYAKKDSRIKVIHKKNGGLSDARNAGIAVSKGDYILLLDGDDCINEKTVERLMNIIAEYPSDIVQFRYDEVSESGQYEKAENSDSDIYQAESAEALYDNLYRLGGVAASSCTKLFKRELLVSVPFENVQHEDEMWCTRAFSDNITCTYIPDILYYYVMREGSITHSNFNDRKFDVFTVIEERIKALEKLNLNDFIHLEYERMFSSLLSLYIDASKAGNKAAQEKIKLYFEKNKQKISEYAHLSGKFGLMFKMMYSDFKAVNMYRLYWKLKG